MICIQLLIKGRVQGVYFRSSSRSVAMELGISGWVRNTKSGDVEVLACGEEKQLAQFVEWCRSGPAKARVEQVEQKASDCIPPKGFEIIR